MAKRVTVKRWTLHFDSASDLPDAEPSGSISWQSEVSVDDYLQLYVRTGSKWNWKDRLVMPEAELRRRLDSPRTQVGVLQNLAELDVGFAEFYAHTPTNVEICYFGLFPEFVGQGLGKGLLDMVIRAAQSRTTEDGVVWLTTCEHDSPGALRFYQRMGFQIVKEDLIEQGADS